MFFLLGDPNFDLDDLGDPTKADAVPWPGEEANVMAALSRRFGKIYIIKDTYSLQVGVILQLIK